MMGWPIRREIRDVGERRRPARHDEEQPPSWPQAANHVADKTSRLAGVFGHVKRADYVVCVGIGRRVLRHGLAAYIGRGRGDMLLQPDIDGMLDMAGKACGSTPYIQHLLARRDQRGNSGKVGTRRERLSPGTAFAETVIEILVELFVSDDHWMEEGEPARRLPQAKTFHVAQQPCRRDPQRGPPQRDQQRAADLLYAPL